LQPASVTKQKGEKHLKKWVLLIFDLGATSSLINAENVKEKTPWQ
jgi:hypothetical protein